jgi:phage gp36-like protein
MVAIAGSRYVTDTSNFLAVTDEKSLIETADDPRGATTDAESFVELAAGAADPRDQILEVISEAVKDAEGTIEGFGAGIYTIPFVPIDPLVKSLALRWAWISLRERKSMLTQSEADDARRAIRDFGDRIANKTIRLVSTLLGDTTALGTSEIHAWGSQEQRLSRDRFEGVPATIGNIARKPTGQW